MNYPVKIVGVVVDVHNLTMYKADGDTIVIPQGDPRIKDLVAKLVPAFDQSGQQFYMLQAEDMTDRNHFADAEQKMGGKVVRFFKMVKSKAKELLEKFVEPVEPMVLGTKEAIKTPPVPVHMLNGEAIGLDQPVVEDAKPKLPPEEERPLTKSAAAVAEIMANAVPATSKNFSVPDEKGAPETTVIAVMEDNTIIPGCEALALQVQAVSEGVGSGTGMQNFLRRAGMIRRGHSVEDLLKFVQKGELPLADDGCVLAYKLLNTTNEEGVFVDVHSSKVKQRVGSFVHMKESLVDPNRHQDCSNGLHVARRDYLKTFSGDACMLVKLAPEDVIAVPKYDARKLRAKGYHIIAELSDSDRMRVKSNQPMEDQVLLGNAIAGNHVGILEYVEITASMGGGLVITPAEGAVQQAPALDTSLTSTSLDHLPSAENPEACQVDARALALEVAKPAPVHLHEDLPAVPLSETLENPPHLPVVEQALAEAPKVKLSKVDELVMAFRTSVADPEKNLAAARALLDFKKQSKKSWTALGISIDDWDAATKVVEMEAAAASLPEAVPPNDDRMLAKPAKIKKAAKPVVTPAVKAPAKPKADPKPKVAKPAATTGVKKMTQQEQMAKLVEIYNRNPDKTNAREIFNFKQKAKKSWEVLGVDDKAFQKKITERAKL